jgi:hypothetical protein
MPESVFPRGRTKSDGGAAAGAGVNRHEIDPLGAHNPGVPMVRHERVRTGDNVAPANLVCGRTCVGGN